MLLRDDAQRVVLRDLDNGKNGHCWLYVVMQACAVDGRWPVALVERAFSHKGSDRLHKLCRAARLVAVKVLDVTRNPFILGDMTGPQVATNPDEIRRLALDYVKHIHNLVDLRNTISYMDPVGGGGGHGGTEAILALAEGIGIDLPTGQVVDSLLVEYINGSTTKRTAVHDQDKGHWSLRVPMVSYSRVF